MALVKFHKVASLPGTLLADSLYFVENGTYVESYVTNSSGVAKSLGNSAMIGALITTAMASLNRIEVVADIAARDAFASGKLANFLVLVLDATADTSVTAGAALYVWKYDATTPTFTKVAEYESMDVSLTWASISGKPSSSAAAIDSAVTNSHTHANKATIDKFSEAGGVVQYDSAPILTSWSTLNW